MTPKTQQVIALKNDGWSLRNIAKEVGVSVFTVRAILEKKPQATPDMLDTAVDAYPNESIPKAEVKNILSGLIAEHSNLQLRLAKKQLVDQFSRIVDEWNDNSGNCSWDLNDLKMYNDSVTRFKKDLFDFCESLGVSAYDLAIFHNASEIKRVFMHLLKDETEITFDFDDEFYKTVDSLKVEDFDDPHTGIDLLELLQDDEN